MSKKDIRVNFFDQNDTRGGDTNAFGFHPPQLAGHYVFDYGTSRPVTIITGTGGTNPKIAYTIAMHLLTINSPYFMRLFDEYPNLPVLQLPNLVTPLFAHYLGFVTGNLGDLDAYARGQAHARVKNAGIPYPTAVQLEVFALEFHIATWFFGYSRVCDSEYCTAIIEAIFKLDNLGPAVVACMDEWNWEALAFDEMRLLLEKDTKLMDLMVDCIMGFLSEEEVNEKIGTRVWWETEFLHKLSFKRMVLEYEPREARLPSWEDREKYLFHRFHHHRI
ncbi:hypothetical protein BST61_g1716 [Cercospora zeina]